ncbi:hypothetical protein LLS1_09450 [Leifsonia sp. LS1]|uniref:DUF1697 domain-containing protein n=1 Tax=Leifsonia sp. LS1 TaxID=2828483 RepID=UPI001CFEE903|nr:DUF1697 domain-containing protein [Leifsonia sp. LS1]GIT79276.1 hypothetical protein LLS1_09450 [Leifsonia sp. LS1]
MLGVGLVRGINVGGAARVSKSELSGAFEDAGLADVTTLLQSGNVVFSTTSAPSADTAAAVETALHARSGVRARVLLLTERGFRDVAAANPLTRIAADDSRLVVTFLDHDLPDDLELPSEKETAPERIVAGDRALYQWCPLGVSKSVVPAAFWRAVGPLATTRNQRTVARLLAELDRRA